MTPLSSPYLKIVVLLSGNGSTLQSFIDAINKRKLAITVCAVISSRNNAYGLTRAKAADIPAIGLDHRHFENKAAFERALKKQIDHYSPDLIILAGFMRILSAEFVSYYPGRILNIHPSLLPKYPGLNTHARVLANKDKMHGTTVHKVTSDLDQGPIIAQAAFPVSPNDTVESLEAKVHSLEHTLYIDVINKFAENGGYD